MQQKKNQIEYIEKITENWYRDDSEVVNFFDKLSYFYTKYTTDSDFVLYSVAINSLWRNKGLFKLLHKKQLELAKKINVQELFLQFGNLSLH